MNRPHPESTEYPDLTVQPWTATEIEQKRSALLESLARLDREPARVKRQMVFFLGVLFSWIVLTMVYMPSWLLTMGFGARPSSVVPLVVFSLLTVSFALVMPQLQSDLHAAKHELLEALVRRGDFDPVLPYRYCAVQRAVSGDPVAERYVRLALLQGRELVQVEAQAIEMRRQELDRRQAEQETLAAGARARANLVTV